MWRYNLFRITIAISSGGVSRFGGGEAVKRSKRICALFILAGCMFLCSGCAPGPEKVEPPATTASGNLVCVQYSSFSGTFPEDGSGRQVNNVAAILVHNSSAEFLDYAKVSCAIGNESGTFLITGLPPGATAWVLEKDAKTVKADDDFGTMQCREYSFRQEAVMATDKLEVSTSGNTVTVVNQSGQTLRNVCLYNKMEHALPKTRCAMLLWCIAPMTASMMADEIFALPGR